MSSERGEKLAGLDSLRQQVKNKDRKKTNKQMNKNKITKQRNWPVFRVFDSR